MSNKVNTERITSLELKHTIALYRDELYSFQELSQMLGYPETTLYEILRHQLEFDGKIRSRSRKPSSKEVLRAHFLYHRLGMSTVDISETMNIHEGTVGKHLHYIGAPPERRSLNKMRAAKEKYTNRQDEPRILLGDHS